MSAAAPCQAAAAHPGLRSAQSQAGRDHCLMAARCLRPDSHPLSHSLPRMACTSDNAASPQQNFRSPEGAHGAEGRLWHFEQDSLLPH